VLLRTDRSVSLPQDAGAADIIDLLDLQDSEGLQQAIHRLQHLRPGPPAPDKGHTPEIQSLLAEIDDPHTRPQRHLEIGDRLAELGDPRPGVGVYEAEVDDAPSVSSTEERTTGYAPQVQSLLDEIDIIETPPQRRLAIGDELAELGDPRPGVGLDGRGLPGIDWVEIPAGRFIYGEGDNKQEVHLERFLISRYPISNAQYQAFVDAGGYEKQGWLKKLTGGGGPEANWWQGLKPPKPMKSTWNKPNRPRTDVDWYEAVAFSRWLAAQLNQPIRLPTEQEWEKAARGTDGRNYPWGDEYINGYANVDESGEKGEYLAQTTAVGLYPMDNSPYGVRDMTGNVWEWCLNKYDQPEQIEPDTSGGRRVLRGGSWFLNPEFARAAHRYRDLPDFRGNDRGFRVLLSAPIN
jgi:formylglycine-generating enzyme required for sulfatase activity